jgi:hypothetical protein
VRRWITLGLLAIVLLTAGAILLVHRLTEPDEAPARRGERAAGVAEVAPANPEPGAQTPALDPGADPGAPIVIAPRPPTPGAVQNESRPIQGPAPVGLPEDPADRQEALEEVRRQRAADQLEQRNRRNQRRAINAAPAPPQARPRPIAPPSADE